MDTNTLLLLLLFVPVTALLVVGYVTGRQRKRYREEAARDVAVTWQPPPVIDAEIGVGLDGLDTPEPVASRLVRLRTRLARSGSGFGIGVLTLLSRDNLDEATWDELEETLLTADFGVVPTAQLVDHLKTRVRVEGL